MSTHAAGKRIIGAAIASSLLLLMPVGLCAQTAAPIPAAPIPAGPVPVGPAPTPPAAATPAVPAAAGTAPEKKTRTYNAAIASKAEAAHPAAAGAPIFPSAVDRKYASRKPGAARMHTCLDQYHANKAAAGNAGLKWIQKGGGYYSLCSKKLKG